MNDESKTSGRDASRGVQVNAGDSLYIPAGGLQIWTKEDGTLGFGLTVAVDPWLPDVSATRGTPLDVVESILAGGFPVSTICNRGSIYGCQKSQDVQALISHPKIQRLRHMVVADGQRAVGVLDLDIARGKFRHGDSKVRFSLRTCTNRSASPIPCTERRPSWTIFSRRINSHSGSSNSTGEARYGRCRGSA